MTQIIPGPGRTMIFMMIMIIILPRSHGAAAVRRAPHDISGGPAQPNGPPTGIRAGAPEFQNKKCIPSLHDSRLRGTRL